MIKKVVKYTDYNGVEQSDTLWFNLTETELMEMELESVSGMATMVRKLIEAEDNFAIYKLFKKIALQAYGVKSEDGRRFIKKNGALADEFVESEAFSALIIDLMSNAEEAARFINGIVPANRSISDEELMKQINKPALEVLKGDN